MVLYIISNKILPVNINLFFLFLNDRKRRPEEAKPTGVRSRQKIDYQPVWRPNMVLDLLGQMAAIFGIEKVSHGSINLGINVQLLKNESQN